MPTNVEDPQQVVNSQPPKASVVPKLGARAVVELLKSNQPVRMPPEFMVIENRKPDAIKSLLQLLTRFQIQVSKSPYANASVLSLITKYLVENKQCLFIAKPDIGAIYLVDGVFEKLLTSGKFDRDAWCLLAQVRFPITKFALQDFSFFFAPQNMGRRLLNSMTLNLLGSAEAQKDQVRKAISVFVDKLNQQYRTNISEFNSVCIEMQSYFASQQRHLSKVETKISKVQKQGQEDRSEPYIIELLNSEVGGKELPALMVDFIYGEWRNSMRLVLRQDGDKSPNWKRQMSLTQSMVQAVEACQTEEGQSQYMRFLPSMLKGIKGLLFSVADDSEALDQTLDPLELVLNALVRGAAPESKQAPMLKSQTVVNESFEVIPVDEKYLQQIEQLTENDWIRIRTPNNLYETCKLSIKGDGNQPWIFVNNTGSKIAKKNKYALALGLKDGVVDIVGKGQWIDDLLRNEFEILALRLEEIKAKAAQEEQEVIAAQQEELEKTKADAAEAQAEVEEDERQAPIEESGEPENTQSEAIELVSYEDQSQTHHGSDSGYQERTDDILSNSTLAIVANEEEADQVSKTTTEPDKEWESYYQEEESYSEEEMAAAQKAVDTLEVGALINLFKDGKEQRCKLAVKMLAKNKYIFVNPLGVKVWDTNSDQVVEAVIKGTVTILDSGVKFDRALEQVVMNIQADKKEQG